MQSFVFRDDRAFDGDRLQGFFRDTIAAHAPHLLRHKGVVAFEGLDHRGRFSGWHMAMISDIGRP